MLFGHNPVIGIHNRKLVGGPVEDEVTGSIAIGAIVGDTVGDIVGAIEGDSVGEGVFGAGVLGAV